MSSAKSSSAVKRSAELSFTGNESTQNDYKKGDQDFSVLVDGKWIQTYYIWIEIFHFCFSIIHNFISVEN